MITELESPFSRRTKQKILKAQEKHISVSEALRLTTKTLGFGMDEPEPDYGENEEEPDYEPDYEDEEDVNTGSYKLVNVDNQMPTTNGVLDFDQLNPEQIRKTMRHHFNETRRKRRSTRRAFDPDGRRYDADDDGYSQRYTDYDRDNRVRGDEIDLEDEDRDLNKVSDWRSLYVTLSYVTSGQYPNDIHIKYAYMRSILLAQENDDIRRQMNKSYVTENRVNAKN